MLSYRLSVVTLLALAACTTKQARRPDTTAPATASLAGTPAADVAAVRQAIEAQDTRFDSAAMKGDSAALVSFYTDDAVVMFANMPAAKGTEAIAKLFGALTKVMKMSAFKLTTQDVIVAGDYAIETGVYEHTDRAAKGGPKHDVGKYLALWKKQPDGSYRIVRDIANTDLPMK